MLIGRPIVVSHIAIEKMRLISFLQSFIPTLFYVDNLLRNSFPFLYPPGLDKKGYLRYIVWKVIVGF